MSRNAETPKADDKSHDPNHPLAAPVAEPSPPLDGAKPVEAGDKEVEKFLVSTDTGGGD
jgi:hypothetical protein